ncbi:MAG TPA: IclR family transcriptional regulator [Trebonia sp.]|nr:IclR family transcriptional regulator [Trebonia sp.]
MMVGAAKPTSASAASALRLVTLLAERGSIRVTEAAHELAVSASTSYRLLALMCELGFAVQEPDRSYTPGPAFARLSLAQSAPDTLRLIVRSHLERLAAIVGETSHLMVREGASVRFLVSAEGPGALKVASREGALLPAHRTSGGKALLAELPAAELGELYPEGMLESLGGHIVSLDALSLELRKVQRQRFAINIEESEQGIAAVGVTLRHRSGQPVGALSISVPTIRFRQERVDELVGALHAVARELEAKI